MDKTPTAPFFTSIVAAILSIVLIVAFLLAPPVFHATAILQVAVLAVYYALIMVSSQHHKQVQWFGFSVVALIFGWQVVGVSLTLFSLAIATFGLYGLAGSRLGAGIRSLRPTFLPRMIFNTLVLGVIVASVSVLRASGLLPTAYAPQTSLFLLILLALISFAVPFVNQRVAAWGAMNVHEASSSWLQTHRASTYSWLDLLLQAILLIAAVVAPLFYAVLGDFTFYIGLAILGVQALHSWRSLSAETALSERLAEAKALDQFREAITAQVTREDVLRVLRETLTACLQIETLAVVLYDDTDEIIEYPVIVEGGNVNTVPSRRFHMPELHQLFPSGQPIYLQPGDDALRDQFGLPPALLRTQKSVALPLVTGDILIGVLFVSSSQLQLSLESKQIALLANIVHQLAMALRNATLYDRTTHIAQNLSIVNQSVQDVMFNLNREEALKRSCQIAAQVTGAARSAIYLVQAGQDNLLLLQQSLGLETYMSRPDIQQIPSQPSGVTVVEGGDGSQHDSSPLHQLTEAVGAVASIQIPLRSSNMTIGKLIVFHDEPRLYSMLERSVLETLANQASAAIDNSDLLQALERFATEQADLVNLSRISTEDLDMERILRAICDVLVDMFLIDRVEIGIVEGNFLRVYAPMSTDTRLLVSQEIPTGQIPEMDEALNPTYAQAVQVYDRHSPALSRSAQQYWADRSARTIITMGMHINQQPLGVVMLMDQRQRTLSEDEMHLLEMVTNQITGQLHNAQVYALTEAALVQRLQQLALLEELTQQIAQSTDLDLIIDTTLEAALQATEAQFAALALQEEQAGTYKLIWQERLEKSMRRGASMASPEPGVVRQVAQTGEVKLIFDNRKSPGYQAPQVAEREYLSTLAVPLYEENRVMGVLRVESTQLNHFTEAQTGFLRNLAEHAAISIEKAQMLAERQRRIQMLTLLRNLSMETLSANNPQHVGHIILRTALQLLDGAAALLFVVEAEQTPQLFSSLTLNGIDLDSVEANLPEAVLRRAVQESTAQMISDVQRSSLLPKDRDLPYRSLIVVPVLRRGIVQELLCIIFEETRLFGLQDLNAVDLLAAQVSGHLENARLNEALHVSYDRLRATINATRSAIILLDMNGIVQELNVVAEGLLGTIGRDIRQQPLASVIHQQHHDDESWQALLQQYQTAPEDVTGQEFIFLQDEKSLDFKASVFPVMGQDETLVGRLLVLRDISEEKDLQRYQYRIQRMIVHDLVGPLGAIITGLTFTKEVLETPQEGEDPAQIILPTVDVSLDSAGNLLHMVETLRDLPQSTNMTTFPTAVTTQSLVNRARDSLSSFLVSDSITFEYRPNGEVPPLYVDADLTRRVIINLLHNAFKFTPEGGTILIAAEQSSEQEGFLRLRVCDTGPGIPPDQRERIFQEYAQIEGRLPRAGGRGMGLGLHFCKLVVEAHGGEIGVDDGGLLSGACISFTLPIATEEQIKAAAKNEK